MTKQEFQLKHAEFVKAFIDDPRGQAFINLLIAYRPTAIPNESPHLYAHNNGKLEGYDLCIKNFVSLLIPIQPKQEVEATYGVAEPKN